MTAAFTKKTFLLQTFPNNMEELPEDIHDYIVSYLSNLEDLLSISRINKQFQAISTRYRHPLTVTDTEWSETKWIPVMHSICKTYPHIDQIHFKRSNVTYAALFGLLTRPMKVINLRECRQLGHDSNWLTNLSLSKCTQLALAKCSKLPDFVEIVGTAKLNHLECLLLDRQTFDAIHCEAFPLHVPNIQTLAITNSILYRVPLHFVTRFCRLKHLFLGGSMLFNPRFKHLLLNVNSIFDVMEIVETQLKYIKHQTEENTAYIPQPVQFDDLVDAIDILHISNHNPVSSNAKTQVLIHALSSIFCIIHQLYTNGVECIELSFSEPYNISLSQLYKYKEDEYTDVHFDGFSVVRLIFLHLLRKYYGSLITLFDFESYPSDYGGLLRLCRKYNDIRMAIEYVVDLAANEFGQTALHIACSDGATQYVQELLACGVHCESRDRRGSTPLFSASVANHYEIVKLLIRNGADIFKRKTTKETPMEIACMRSHVETIKIMLDAVPFERFNDNTKYDNQWSPIHCCCLSGNTQTVNLLIDSGLNYAAQNFWKESPLHICAVKNYVDCARILTRKYDLRELMLRDEFNKTAEQIARQNNNFDIVKLIQLRRYELNKHNQRHGNWNHDYYGRYEQNNYNRDNNYRPRRGRGQRTGRERRRRGRGRGTQSARYYYRVKPK
eukprot:925934_1